MAVFSESWIKYVSTFTNNNTGLVFTKLIKPHEHADKWVGKVCGSKDQIVQALVDLGREPMDSRELRLKIIENIHKGLEKVLEEAELQHQYCPY